MNLDGFITTISAGVVAALGVGESSRRYWHRREERQQASFRAAVQSIVDTSVAEVIRRQVEFEQRQGRHLDRQDRAIDHLRRMVERRTGEVD